MENFIKKNIFRLIISVITFFLGLGAVAFIYLQFNPVPKVTENDFLFVSNKVCTFLQGFPGKSEKISEIKKGKSGYFPSKSWNDYETEDDFLGDWYGKRLRAMKEKSLLKSTNENTEIYRFFWLRSFHHPIFVRIEKRNSKIKLFTKELDGTGSSEPVRILKSKEISLTEEDFLKFLDLINRANFWQMPTSSKMGRDGAQWILEGVKDNRYHIVDRWSPEKGDFREACIYLLKLSGRDVDELKDDLY